MLVLLGLIFGLLFKANYPSSVLMYLLSTVENIMVNFVKFKYADLLGGDFNLEFTVLWLGSSGNAAANGYFSSLLYWRI